MHTIVIRPTADFEPTVSGIYKHAVQVAEGAEIVTESTDYLRAIARVCNERADRMEGDDDGPKRDLLTTDELAAMLRTSPGTVRFWHHKGKGPTSTKVGRRRLYARADVEAWIEAAKTDPDGGA